MKFPVKTFCLVAAVGGLLTVLGGCETDGGGGGGPVVYGDVGYVGAWSYPGAWYGGGDRYVQPPYDHSGGGGDHGGGGRPGPSIPNISRPSGGSGGGHPSGGGGGARGGGGGGGGGDRRH